MTFEQKRLKEIEIPEIKFPPNLWYPAKALQGTEYVNICVWYDRTLVPMKGHKGNCRWKFDGQIWRHL